MKRRNDNHSPGPVIRELVPSSHQRSELSNTILCIFSGWDQRIGEGIPIPDSLGEEATFININNVNFVFFYHDPQSIWFITWQQNMKEVLIADSSFSFNSFCDQLKNFKKLLKTVEWKKHNFCQSLGQVVMLKLIFCKNIMCFKLKKKEFCLR